MSYSSFSGFNDHKKIEGEHAFLGASKYHWINYDPDRLMKAFGTFKAAEKGTKLHKFAKDAIDLGIKLPHSDKAICRYVNDGIGLHMKTEVMLYYNKYAFGTADAISFYDGLLRIHDLKTGDTKAHMQQLYIYAALFCLEYHINPFEIQFELRLYQYSSVIYERTDPKIIKDIADKIVKFTHILEQFETNGYVPDDELSFDPEKTIISIDIDDIQGGEI